MLTAHIAFEFITPYVGNPYWPEMFEVIEITKKSGMNRAKSDANRRKALEEYLRQNGMTLDDFRKLEELAKRPFHRLDDADQSTEIVIPDDRVTAFLVAACDTARAAYRASPPEQVRSRIKASHFLTGKTESDGTWRRFATVNLGTGARASNQRGLREDEYIENFTARGTLQFDEETVDPETLENMIKWAGEFVGIGAARKMGKGRFTLAQFDVQGEVLAEAAE